MSATYFTLCNGVPPGIGTLTYVIHDMLGRRSKITVQYDGVALHPTPPEQSPWTVQYQITDAKSSKPILVGEARTISDPSARVTVDVAMLIDANTTPVPIGDDVPARWKPIEGPTRTDPLSETPVTKTLAFDIQQQLQTQWCWAAVSSSVCDFYRPHGTPPDPDFTQCGLASWAFAPAECCKDGGSSACNRPYLQSLALQHVHHRHESFGGAMQFDKIQEEIVAGRPIAVTIAWTLGGAHAVAITGYTTIEKVQYVQVQDPGGATKQLIPLARFPQGGSWNWTVTTQA